jgi:hypothetical protein
MDVKIENRKALDGVERSQSSTGVKMLNATAVTIMIIFGNYCPTTQVVHHTSQVLLPYFTGTTTSLHRYHTTLHRYYITTSQVLLPYFTGTIPHYTGTTT